jgi:hypothetical protein
MELREELQYDVNVELITDEKRELISPIIERSLESADANIGLEIILRELNKISKYEEGSETEQNLELERYGLQNEDRIDYTELYEDSFKIKENSFLKELQKVELLYQLKKISEFYLVLKEKINECKIESGKLKLKEGNKGGLNKYEVRLALAREIQMKLDRLKEAIIARLKIIEINQALIMVLTNTHYHGVEMNDLIKNKGLKSKHRLSLMELRKDLIKVYRRNEEMKISDNIGTGNSIEDILLEICDINGKYFVNYVSAKSREIIIDGYIFKKELAKSLCDYLGFVNAHLGKASTGLMTKVKEVEGFRRNPETIDTELNRIVLDLGLNFEDLGEKVEKSN